MEPAALEPAALADDTKDVVERVGAGVAEDAFLVPPLGGTVFFPILRHAETGTKRNVFLITFKALKTFLLARIATLRSGDWAEMEGEEGKQLTAVLRSFRCTRDLIGPRARFRPAMLESNAMVGRKRLA